MHTQINKYKVLSWKGQHCDICAHQKPDEIKVLMFNVNEYWGPTNTTFSGTNTNISKRKNISSPSHLIICCFYPWGSWGCYCFIPLFSKGSRGVTGYWSQSQLSLWVKAGYTLNESPAYCRALTDGRGQHARCQLHIRSNFGVQHLGQRYFNMQLSSTLEEGLPAKLQLPHAQKKKKKKKHFHINMLVKTLINIQYW